MHMLYLYHTCMRVIIVQCAATPLNIRLSKGKMIVFTIWQILLFVHFFISFFINNVRYVCMYSAKYIKARPFIGGRFSVLLKDQPFIYVYFFFFSYSFLFWFIIKSAHISIEYYLLLINGNGTNTNLAFGKWRSIKSQFEWIGRC